jgi:hypothetical protein
VDTGGTGHTVAPCGHATAGVLVGFHGAAAVEQSLKRKGQCPARELMTEAMDGIGGRGERAAVSERVADSPESRAGAGPTIAQRLAPSLKGCGRGQVRSEGVDLAAEVVVDRPDRGEGRQGGQRTVGMEDVAASGGRLEERCLQRCELRVFARRDDVVAPPGCEDDGVQRADDAGVDPAVPVIGVQIVVPGAGGDASRDELEDADVKDDAG